MTAPDPRARLGEATPDGTWFTVHGQGSPVVLVHGVGLDHSMWRAQIAALARHRQVVAYDMLGHGRSAKPAGQRQLDDFAEQLTRLLEHLVLGPISLIGFSMGGAVAQNFAVQHPNRLRRLVLMNTVFRRTNRQRVAVLARLAQVKEAGSANIDAAIARWFAPEFQTRRPDVIAHVRTLFTNNDPAAYFEAYRVFATADAELWDAPRTITCPTLVMTGEFDVNSTPDMTHALAAAIPNAKAIVIPRQRHMMPMEDPESVNAALLDFLVSKAIVQ